MGVITESLCFCNGVGRSEKMKAAIFSGKSPAVVRISDAGTGFLIHRNLLVTTHGNIPSASAAECAIARVEGGGAAAAALSPNRFFITSAVLDLTMVGIDAVVGDSSAQNHQQLPHFLKPCAKPNLDHGNAVYMLGYTAKKELAIGEGKVVIATDNLIKLSTDGFLWSPGSAGFDAQGNLAFMICDPMKLATSPNTKSSSTATSSSSSTMKKDLATQFGIPIPIICDWLNQHWEGSLDEVSKPKLPIIRLMSAGQKSEHCCTSFTMRQVFKSTDCNVEGTASSSFDPSMKLGGLPGPSSSAAVVVDIIDEENRSSNPHALHMQGIPTPEIFESPKVTSMPVRRKESPPTPLLDINFPPRITKPPISLTQLCSSRHPKFAKDRCGDCHKKFASREEEWRRDECAGTIDEVGQISSVGSVNDAPSEVQSCSSPPDASEIHNGGFSSEEETMYSAETAESRNIPSPEGGRPQPFGRTQSCMNYNTKWGPSHRNSMTTNRRALLEKQRSFVQGRKVYSHGGTSQRSNDYCSPTVSSIMKKRMGLEQPQPARPRQSAAAAAATIHSSPRWVF
ncbi:hypothetical protein MLD38_012408 [Melastoma candidum]|uniref:Uncharacterized protein n=1 Tax=Melastoma candidum TaxID=119954 RepID=A0ACB9REN4_9MYRT|nr:hypothetical protein MLD38_012408 [Melastoma candidum]